MSKECLGIPSALVSSRCSMKHCFWTAIIYRIPKIASTTYLASPTALRCRSLPSLCSIPFLRGVRWHRSISFHDFPVEFLHRGVGYPNPISSSSLLFALHIYQISTSSHYQRVCQIQIEYVVPYLAHLFSANPQPHRAEYLVAISRILLRKTRLPLYGVFG